MNRKATKIEQQKYGSIYFIGPVATKEEVEELERNGQGAIGVMFLPTYNSELRTHFSVPLKWQYRGNAIYFPALTDILPSHFEELYQVMQTEQARKSYSNPQHYQRILTFMKKWKLKQDTNTNMPTSPPLPSKISFQDLQTQQLILINASQVIFARKTPIAIIKQLLFPEIEVTLMTLSEITGEIIPLNNSSHIIHYKHILRILCGDNDQNSQQLAYYKLKHENIDIKYKKIKTHETRRMTFILESYLGTKIKKSQNLTNFVKFRKKQKPTKIEQEFA
eukprot:205691_1